MISGWERRTGQVVMVVMELFTEMTLTVVYCGMILGMEEGPTNQQLFKAAPVGIANAQHIFILAPLHHPLCKSCTYFCTK